MGKFDFLDNLGKSRDEYQVVITPKNLKDKIQYLEILVNRNLMTDDFKEKILQLFSETKSDELFQSNIQKSISQAENIEVRILDIDKEMFKLKNDEFEYVEAIDRMPKDGYKLSPNRGKVSYNFAMHLHQHLKNRVITLKDIILLSDILDFKILNVFEVEQLTK